MGVKGSTVDWGNKGVAIYDYSRDLDAKAPKLNKT
jgi:hypothetical protein